MRKVDDLYIFDSSGTVLLADVSNPEDEFPIPSEEIFEKALEGNPVSVNLSKENKTAFIIKLGNFIDTYLYISKNIQPQLLQYLDETEQAVNFYYTVENNRTGIKITFAIIYIIIVSLLLFLTIVLAVTFAQRLTKPIINLISASKNISAGKLDSRVPDIDADEDNGDIYIAYRDYYGRVRAYEEQADGNYCATSACYSQYYAYTRYHQNVDVIGDKAYTTGYYSSSYAGGLRHADTTTKVVTSMWTSYGDNFGYRGSLAVTDDGDIYVTSSYQYRYYYFRNYDDKIMHYDCSASCNSQADAALGPNPASF